MKVCVTGARGFIGRWVVTELYYRRHKVMAYDSHRDRTHEYPTGTEIFLGDVTNRTHCFEALGRCDAWIHLAAVLGTQETVKSPDACCRTNILGALNMLEAAANYNSPGVYIGVGNHWMNNPYSITKSAAERLCLCYNENRRTNINIVRGMNAYGPYQRAAQPFAPGYVRKIMPAFVCRALSNIPIEVYGDGRQTSDMIWVGDLARTLVTAMEHAHAGRIHPIIECGPLIHHTVIEVAEKVRDAAGSDLPIAHIPMRPGESVGRPVVADPDTMLDADINPADFVSLDEGIQQTVEWFRQRKGTWWHEPHPDDLPGPTNTERDFLTPDVPANRGAGL